MHPHSSVIMRLQRHSWDLGCAMCPGERPPARTVRPAFARTGLAASGMVLQNSLEAQASLPVLSDQFGIFQAMRTLGAHAEVKRTRSACASVS